MLLIYALLIALVAILLKHALPILRKNYKNKKMLQGIAAPPEMLLFGHFHLLMENPENWFVRARKFAKMYYPMYRFSTFNVNIIHLLDPNDIELVLSSTKHLSKGNIYEPLQNWLGTGLLTSSGAKWHKRRKILTPAFHFSILRQFQSIFNKETNRFIEKLTEECGRSIDLVPAVSNFTFQAISETAMGLSGVDESTQREYKSATYEMGRILLKRIATPWYRIKAVYNMSKLARDEGAAIEVLHGFSNKMIINREKEMKISRSVDDFSKKNHLAMLDLLLAAKNEGADIDYEGIREEVDTVMLAGQDTTTMALSFVLLVLANLQDVQANILNEILSVLGPSKLPSFNDLRELKYTERCIKETLRLFPSVTFIARTATEDFTTRSGHTIPEGTILDIHIFDVHRDERIYPDPLKFDPDRFLPENISTRHPFAYIPFSAGPRNCLGQKFAFLEIKTVLCGILRRFKLEKVDDMNEVEFRTDLVLRPKKNIKVKILERNLAGSC